MAVLPIEEERSGRGLLEVSLLTCSLFCAIYKEGLQYKGMCHIHLDGRSSLEQEMLYILKAVKETIASAQLQQPGNELKLN